MSPDSFIKVWDIRTAECLQSILCHHDIRCVCSLGNGSVALGLQDLFIKIWNGSSGFCSVTLTGHDDVIRCLCSLSDGTIASGSLDMYIKIWNVSSGVCLRTLNGHFMPANYYCNAG